MHGTRTARPAALVRRFLLCASTLLGVSPVSSLLRLDVLLSSSLLCVLRSTGACQGGSSLAVATSSKGDALRSRLQQLALALERGVPATTPRSVQVRRCGRRVARQPSRCAPVVLDGVVGPGSVGGGGGVGC